MSKQLSQRRTGLVAGEDRSRFVGTSFERVYAISGICGVLSAGMGESDGQELITSPKRYNQIIGNSQLTNHWQKKQAPSSSNSQMLNQKSDQTPRNKTSIRLWKMHLYTVT